MLLLRELRTSRGVSLALWGDAHDLQRLADQLAGVGNAELAALVRQAASTAKVVAGRPMGSVSFRFRQAGVPHALMEAADEAGVDLECITEDIGLDTSFDPKG